MMTTVDACPICGDTRYMKRSGKVYGYEVCKKCRSKFANRRQFAYFIDMVLVNFLQAAAGAMLGIALVSNEAMLAAAGWGLTVGFIVLMLIKDGFSGKSPGKALMGVQAIDEQTREPIGFGTSLKRNLPTLIPFFPLVIALQLIKGKRFGDGWARSKVIWSAYATSPVFGGDSISADQGFGPVNVSLPPLQDNANPYQSPRQ